MKAASVSYLVLRCLTFISSFECLYISGSSERNAINRGASNFGTRTGGCVRGIPRTSQSNYVAITSDDAGCYAYAGRQGGRQVLNLQRGGCLRSGTIEHEMLHALGVWHEHSRPDR